MPLISLLLAVALFASGCEDALGPEHDCRDQMKAVRQDRGSPDQVQSDENAGDYFESWTYFPAAGDPGASYLFRWGVSFDNCSVDGPVDFNVIPVSARSAISRLFEAPADGARLLTAGGS